MIITRSPLRITLGGGGTDLPAYYEAHTGFLIAAAIDKYVYLTVHRSFEPSLILKYSELERVDSVDAVRHPIIREALRLTGLGPPLEIASLADIPAGTGLGSSGSFTTALLKALHGYKQEFIHPRELAAEACSIEMERLGAPVGKQDPYIAAFGGLTCFRFLPGGAVEAWPLALAPDMLANLEENLLLFYTGITRPAARVLAEQERRGRAGEAALLDNLHTVKALGEQSRAALEAGDLTGFAALMNTHWEIKKARASGTSSPQIDAWYALARANGALGGKLIGAGGGGFLMFYAEDKARLRAALRAAGLAEVRFHFDFEGTRVVAQS